MGAVAVYALILAGRNSDSLFLKINDEHAYMIQTRMLASGRLWLPAYPAEVSSFFDALAMVVDRVYASMYFPGTAVATVPFVWAHLPFWLMPLTAASVAAGLLYAVVAQVFDPVRGIIAAMLLVSLNGFVEGSELLLSEMPFLAAELTMVLAWFAFRREPGWKWALVIGAAGGFAAITRPLDAVCFCAPIGMAIVWQLRRDPAAMVRLVSVIVLGGAPFIALLIAQSAGISGHWNEFAETYYNRKNFPASPIGFHRVDPQYIPPGMNAAKQQWLRDWVLPSFRNHTPINALRSWPRGRLVQILDASVPDWLLRILIPLGLLSLVDLRRIVLTAALAAFALGYAIYLFFLSHYVLTILPSMICLILMGWDAIQRAWPGGKRLGTFLAVFMLCAAGGAMGKTIILWQAASDSGPDQRPANDLLAKLPMTPAVVLFRFDPRAESFHDDPVYNDGVAFPDDATVVRARDLGPERNRAIVHYYAKHQPDRVFYIYDPDARAAGENPISPPLGQAGELDITGTIP
jgi:Dolichyl-phosphate-mannose-protein mannosyltransferase